MSFSCSNTYYDSNCKKKIQNLKFTSLGVLKSIKIIISFMLEKLIVPLKGPCSLVNCTFQQFCSQRNLCAKRFFAIVSTRSKWHCFKQIFQFVRLYPCIQTAAHVPYGENLDYKLSVSMSWRGAGGWLWLNPGALGFSTRNKSVYTFERVDCAVQML
jgi:hypothetical protein